MKRWKTVAVVALIVLAALLAGFFDFPDYINPWLQKVPGGVQVPTIPFRLGLDLQGGVHLVYQADLSKVDPLEYDAAMQGLRDVIERRVNFFGVSEPLVQTEGRGDERRLIVEIAGVINSQEAIDLIGRAPLLEFREPKDNYEEILASNDKVFETGEGELQEPFQETGLNGSLLQRADVGFEQFAQEPVINLTFNSEGARLFEEITGRHIGRPVAIFLDNQLLSEPIVQSQIAGGQAQITGSYTVEEAQQLVRDLNAGAVPVSIELLSQQQVGPTLGSVSLQQSLRAGMAGLLLVIVFMTFMYRLPGVLASIALVFYGIFLLFIFKVLGFTFTLAGIAGLILSIGMAVDANILIFSRMREELQEGKSFAQSVEEGFKRAWPAIRDGNITTLLIALILFWFGTSFVQGFALALSIGILVSMFSAVVVTKSFLRLFAGTPLEKVRRLWS
ncbi:MAG TPA: protein translocase subunit SecD [Candidatus Paceibacterota bacterium]|nr:protein translocase subunit SecD [Candidatus Paceibacterota bacterium]